MLTLNAALVAALAPSFALQGYSGGGPPVPEKVQPSTSLASNLEFGDAVSLADQAFAAGAPDPSGANGSGRAFVFEEQSNGTFGGGGVELTAPVLINGQNGARFGDAVAAESAGSSTMVAVGAPGANLPGGGGTVSNAGIAYVYTGSSGAYTVTDTLQPFVSNALEEFGASVAMRGTSSAVGAPATASNSSRGSVTPFEDLGGGFQQIQGNLLPDGAAPTNANFGSTVAINGNLLVAGAPGDDSVNGPNTGTVYVYERSGPGSPWIGLPFPDNKIVGAQVQFGDIFGDSVALSGDLLVVGAPFADDVGCLACPSSGAAYVFQRQAGSFVQTDQLFASNAATANRFGSSVAISDGRILVGAAGGNFGAGAVYVFEGDPGSYTEAEELGGNTGSLNGDDLGGSVTANGTRFLAGAPKADSGGFADLGAAYVFEVEPLLGNPDFLSLSAGGSQELLLRAGNEFGSLPYLVVFSQATGFLPLGSVVLPLSLDPLLLLTAENPNTPPFNNTFGFLDGAGNAEADFTIPPGSPASLAGVTFFAAYVVVDLTATPVFASDTSPVTFLP